MLAKRDPRELVFNKDALDALVKDRLGITKQKDMAALLEIRESAWSQLRNGKRPLNGPLVAAMIDIIPGVPVQSYCRTVPAESLAKS
jgi:hypothetical protein